MFLLDLKALNNSSLHSQPNSIKRQRVKSPLDKQGIKLLKFWFPTQSFSLLLLSLQSESEVPAAFVKNLLMLHKLETNFLALVVGQPHKKGADPEDQAPTKNQPSQSQPNNEAQTEQSNSNQAPTNRFNQPKPQRQNCKAAKIVPTSTTHESIQSEYSF